MGHSIRDMIKKEIIKKGRKNVVQVKILKFEQQGEWFVKMKML